MNKRIKSKNLLTDSRFVSHAEDACFFAIKGTRHDGHEFIEELAKKGVNEFVVERGNSFVFFGETYTPNDDFNIEKYQFWVVDNAITTLQQLAKQKRESYNYPIIGITGSNGKTIVKEWLGKLLESNKKIVKTPRSYNSQLGVPLSVWQMDQNHQVGIFEAGISEPSEMKKLGDIIQANIGVFTNIGTAHSEGFKSKKQKITEKLRLFDKSSYLIYPKNDSELDQEINIFLKAINPDINLIGWTNNYADKYAAELIIDPNILKIKYERKEFQFDVPFHSEAQIENLTNTLFTLLALENFNADFVFNQKLIAKEILQLKGLPMRLQLKEGIHNSQIIDDTYTNDFGGLSMALNFMNQQESHRKKVLIISDFPQEKIKDEQLYSNLANLVEQKGIDQVIGIGPKLTKFQGYFKNISTFENTEKFLEDKYAINQFNDSLILIKGGREYKFEKIVHRLEQKSHGTQLEINLDAITHNLNFYRSKIKAGTKLMVMVKAFSYGNGGVEIAALLQYHRVDYIAVANLDEGKILRNNGIKLPILVLNPDADVLEDLAFNNLEAEIYDFALLNKLIEKGLTNLKIHIKLDTGMNRLGFIAEDVPDLISIIKANPQLEVKSIFSHLAVSDELDQKEFTFKQIKLFDQLSSQINSVLPYPALRHICNTSGISNFPEAAFDMVRLGIGLYGVDKSNQEELRQVGTLKTTILQIKKVKAGDTVGYGRKGKITADSEIAVLAIGYADGFKRSFSQGVGQVYYKDKNCPIVGNICMDLSMINVTGLNAKVGDSVIVYGTENPIYEMADKINTIPYELLTSIGQRVKRVFLKE